MNFLLFFILTIAVVVTSVFFSFQVPLKENDKLRAEADSAVSEKVFLQSFAIKMQETINLLDSVNLTTNPFRVENRIENAIKEMTAKVDEAPNSLKALCNQVIDNLSTLRMAKQQIRSSTTNTNEMEKKDQQIKDLQNAYQQCQAQLLQFSRPVK